jgi:hypothetical protein
VDGSDGVFVAEWKADGTPSWLHTFEGGLFDACTALAIEGNPESPHVGDTLIAFEKSKALHLARIDGDGTLVYEISHGFGLGTPGVDVSSVQAATTDGEGGVWVTGMVMGGAARSVGGAEFTPPGSSAIFLAKYDIETGAHLWSGMWGSPAHYGIVGFDRAYDVSVIGDKVIIAALSLPQIDFGAGPLGPQPDGNKANTFLAAFDLQGAPQWSLEALSTDQSTILLRELRVTSEMDLAILCSGRLMRMNPVDGSLLGESPIEAGADHFAVDSEGMAFISYTIYDSISFGDVTLTSAGNTDIVLNRVPMP